MDDIWFTNDGAMHGGVYGLIVHVIDDAELGGDETLMWATIGELLAAAVNEWGADEDDVQMQLEMACEDMGVTMPAEWEAS